MISKILYFTLLSSQSYLIPHLQKKKIRTYINMSLGTCGCHGAYEHRTTDRWKYFHKIA